ncbi:MAG TPA: NAD-dependent epimerase/dehydratase family protein [Brevundimonas sp.]|jgi:UDP-2-acetamido-2,6-beta-L-arabino-hexul-4-ose reductase|uniref:UDP-2-acetamido-2,6-beta-L-arabino-hexul-4-ose reductase n=1 Tax=Brevundimonas sp. TaxID=1871086 RepID=UPI002DEA11E5|nr:NAD-dependent epimerase/dehydratase family protein [Brevundimonas sp.]
MAVVVTGANGFVGKTLMVRLAERGVDAVGFGRGDDEAMLAAVARADFVFHLAGVNRPQNEEEFVTGNADLTARVCAALAAAGNAAPLVISSSTQAERDNPYGRSKRAAEDAALAHAAATGAPVHVFRLTNVFGKWARPNYNSAVATFCHNVAHGLPISVNDPAAPLKLVYVDDVCDAFLRVLDDPGGAHGDRPGFAHAGPEYETTVGAVADLIRRFPESRTTMVTDRVGTGLTRALHATYLSYLKPEDFAYDVPRHGDPRGVFVEMLKTPDCGQFSYFTAGPGITRGQHYHHTKTEKFLVLTGRARFGFRHILTGETFHLETEGGQGRIVETIPGWTHDITNVGDQEMVVMLWANEIFDRARPDTVAMKV